LVALALVGVPRMLHDFGCEHLPMLNSLAISSEASVLEEIPAEVQKINGQLVRKWCTHHGLPEGSWRRRIETDLVCFNS
jgi:hypothetical protein